ncbi:MAG: hypothetical protein JOZ97_07990 [Candidatus Eremiobacteraeota bacterium]|nr:hypothetical protein [Candidatus Eremiobacteraeota bacterium]
MAFDFDQADTLIYSDNPEALRTALGGNPAVHVATPTNAILYEAEVVDGRKRVFYYHQNFDATPRTIAMRLVNLTQTAVTLKAIKHIETPAGEVLSVGHRSVVGFLKALVAEGWSSFTLQPVGQADDDVVFAVSVAGAGQLASAFVELDIPVGANIKVQVISAASEAGVAGVGKNGPIPGDGDLIGRSGVYDLTRNGTSAGDSGDLTWTAGGPRLEISVPSPPTFPNSKIPKVGPKPNPPGGMYKPSEAVYGVFTRRTITLANPTGAEAEVGVYIQACGGDSPGTCMLDDELIELGTMSSPTDAKKRPGYEIGSYKIPAGDPGNTTIEVLATVDPSGSGPLKIVVAPKGTVLEPPPGSKQVVFTPGGAPWQA